MAKSKKTFRPERPDSDNYYRAVMLVTELAPGGQAIGGRSFASSEPLGRFRASPRPQQPTAPPAECR